MDNQEVITERVRQIFYELTKQRKVKYNRDFFGPLDISDSVATLILNEKAKNRRDFPKRGYEPLIRIWGVNPDFLYNGNGKMFLQDVQNNVVQMPVQIEGENIGQVDMHISDFGSSFIEMGDGSLTMFVPLVEEYAQAGYLSGFSDQAFLKELPKHPIIVDKYHKGNYFAFRVIGDSMDDGSKMSIPSRSIVVGREIQKTLWTSRFHIHRYKEFIIVHKEGILIKEITSHDVDNGVIECHSYNPDKEKYPDFKLNLDEIDQMLNIVNITTPR